MVGFGVTVVRSLMISYSMLNCLRICKIQLCIITPNFYCKKLNWLIDAEGLR